LKGSKGKESSDSGRKEPGKIESREMKYNRDSYGLIGGKPGAIAASSRGDSLGPPKALVEAKAHARAEKETERRDRGNNVSKLSEGEKKRRLDEMMTAAGEVTRQRARRVEHAREREATSSAELTKTGGTGAPTFIDKMQQETYSKSTLKLEERLRQNRHYTQKGSSLDSAGFTRK
jgi:hypothetical protein